MILGLTGGIATGKSQSAKYLQELGAYCIDADLISKKLTKKNMPALRALVKEFGKEILLLEGSLNRKKLSNIVFSDKASKLKVEKILHNDIVYHIKSEAFANKDKEVIVINAPLLFEVELNKMCDKIVVVWAPYNLQLARLTRRNNFSKHESQKMIQSQLHIEKKMQLADFVVDNSGTKQSLKSSIISLYKLCKKLST